MCTRKEPGSSGERLGGPVHVHLPYFSRLGRNLVGFAVVPTRSITRHVRIEVLRPLVDYGLRGRAYFI